VSSGDDFLVHVTESTGMILEDDAAAGVELEAGLVMFGETFVS